MEDSCAVETGLSDWFWQALNYTVSNKNPIDKPSEMKRFENDLFRLGLDNELSKLDVFNLEFDHFWNIFNNVLNNLWKRNS